jgi:hypothetical protein
VYFSHGIKVDETYFLRPERTLAMRCDGCGGVQMGGVNTGVDEMWAAGC